MPLEISEKPHFYRLQVDFPFDGNLANSKYEICWKKCLVDLTNPNTILGDIPNQQGIMPINLQELIAQNPNLLESLQAIQLAVVNYCQDKLT